MNPRVELTIQDLPLSAALDTILGYHGARFGRSLIVAMSSQRTLYKVIFQNQGKIYEVYVRNVSQSGLLGFVEIGAFVFGEKSALVLDPTEEKLKAEFDGVKRAYIPMHAVVRIDEVEKEGVNKILPGSVDSKVTPFPSPIFSPPKDGNT